MSLDVAARGERLAGLDDEEILGVDFVMLGQIVVLLCDKYALAKQILVNLLPVCLGNEPTQRSIGLRWSIGRYLTSWRL